MSNGFAQTLRDYNRHSTNFNKTIVDEVLPEHFRTDYPNLVTFLDAYYEFLDSADNFGGIIEELQTVRDIEDTKLEYLDYLFDEIGLGISGGQFETPREVIRNFGNFFRVKGSEYSIHGFFRAFFKEEIEIFHPKNSLFVVGESNIGTEDAKKIQDGRLYQVFSTLIKGPIALVEWESLYRKFVHPSGFYLGAAVVLESEPALNITTLTSIPIVDNSINVFGNAALTYGAEGETVGAVGYTFPSIPYDQVPPPGYYTDTYGGLDGPDKDPINYEAKRYVNVGYVAPNYAGFGNQVFRLRDRYNFGRTMGMFQNMPLNIISGYYSSLDEWAGFRVSFDEKLDPTGATSNNVPNSAVKFSSAVDTFDARAYFRK